MSDQLSVDHEDLPDTPWETAYVMVFVILCVILACTFFYVAAVTVAALAMAASTPSSVDETFQIAPTFVFPGTIMGAATAAFISYLIVLWAYRQSLKRIHLYLFIAIGAVAIPIAVSTAHFFNYDRSPASYQIPFEKHAYVRQLGDNSLRNARADYARFQDYSALITRVRAQRSILPARLQFVGPVGPCLNLDLGSLTGAVCVAREVIVTQPPPDSRTPPVIVEEPQLFLKTQMASLDSSLDLSTLFEPTQNPCPSAVTLPGEGRRGSADTDRLFRCLAAAQQLLDKDLPKIAARIDRARVYPDISYLVILLDSSADIVDADYSILDPVAPLAGFISVSGSLLMWIYFGVFASLVVEDATARELRSRKSAEGKKAAN